MLAQTQEKSQSKSKCNPKEVQSPCGMDHCKYDKATKSEMRSGSDMAGSVWWLVRHKIMESWSGSRPLRKQIKSEKIGRSLLKCQGEGVCLRQTHWRCQPSKWASQCRHSLIFQLQTEKGGQLPAPGGASLYLETQKPCNYQPELLSWSCQPRKNSHTGRKRRLQAMQFYLVVGWQKLGPSETGGDVWSRRSFWVKNTWMMINRQNTQNRQGGHLK